MSKHICHAHHCETPCPPTKLMCGDCWSKIPKTIQKRVYATYKEGQCSLSPLPSPEWHTAADLAITWMRGYQFNKQLTAQAERIEEQDKEIERLRPCQAALRQLVMLKDYKDAKGKDDRYMEQQPRVWHRAREALNDE